MPARGLVSDDACSLRHINDRYRPNTHLHRRPDRQPEHGQVDPFYRPGRRPSAGGKLSRRDGGEEDGTDAVCRPAVRVDRPARPLQPGPRSRDEMVAVDLLLGRRATSPPVDAVLCIVDASNLQRNLYLVSQVLELGLPTVLAVNMLDVAEDHGSRSTWSGWSSSWACRWRIQANRRIGLGRLKTLLAAEMAS